MSKKILTCTVYDLDNDLWNKYTIYNSNEDWSCVSGGLSIQNPLGLAITTAIASDCNIFKHRGNECEITYFQYHDREDVAKYKTLRKTAHEIRYQKLSLDERFRVPHKIVEDDDVSLLALDSFIEDKVKDAIKQGEFVYPVDIMTSDFITNKSLTINAYYFEDRQLYYYDIYEYKRLINSNRLFPSIRFAYRYNHYNRKHDISYYEPRYFSNVEGKITSYGYDPLSYNDDERTDILKRIIKRKLMTFEQVDYELENLMAEPYHFDLVFAPRKYGKPYYSREILVENVTHDMRTLRDIYERID